MTKQIQSQNQMLQQQVQTQQANNQTSLILKDPSILQGSFFTMGNMTFSHQMASVNGVQLHYVIGGHGDPLVLLHGWPQTWYEWHNVMPALAKNYTVIAPDLRGLGDSSKPASGYDGKTVAEDIYQLTSQLGFNRIFLVGHDIGAIPAYTYAAVHPNNVSKLVLMELTFPGYTPPTSISGNPGRWWVAFHQVPDMPEVLVQGKEREYLTYFFKGLAYNPSAITQYDIDEFVSHYSAPGEMRAGFEYYKALPQDAKEFMELAKSKLTMPVLVISGDIYPILGGDIPGSSTFNSIQNLSLATNVKSIIVPLSGHWIAEEQPQFFIKQIANFFSQNNNTNSK